MCMACSDCKFFWITSVKFLKSSSVILYEVAGLLAKLIVYQKLAESMMVLMNLEWNYLWMFICRLKAKKKSVPFILFRTFFCSCSFSIFHRFYCCIYTVFHGSIEEWFSSLCGVSKIFFFVSGIKEKPSFKSREDGKRCREASKLFSKVSWLGGLEYQSGASIWCTTNPFNIGVSQKQSVSHSRDKHSLSSCIALKVSLFAILSSSTNSQISGLFVMMLIFTVVSPSLFLSLVSVECLQMRILSEREPVCLFCSEMLHL